MPDEFPMFESLKLTIERTLPYWNDVIVPQIKEGKRVLIAAHGNSLRGIVKHLDNMSNDEIMGLNLPTGIPFVYELDEDMKPVVSMKVGCLFCGSRVALLSETDALSNLSAFVFSVLGRRGDCEEGHGGCRSPRKSQEMKSLLNQCPTTTTWPRWPQMVDTLVLHGQKKCSYLYGKKNYKETNKA